MSVLMQVADCSLTLGPKAFTIPDIANRLMIAFTVKPGDRISSKGSRGGWFWYDHAALFYFFHSGAQRALHGDGYQKAHRELWESVTQR
jgi:hypothetical protein